MAAEARCVREPPEPVLAAVSVHAVAYVCPIVSNRSTSASIGGRELLACCTARRNFDRCDASAVEYDEPITVFGAQHSRILRQCRDHVFHKLVLVGDVRFVVRDVHAVAADEPDAQHRSCHVVEASRVGAKRRGAVAGSSIDSRSRLYRRATAAVGRRSPDTGEARTMDPTRAEVTTMDTRRGDVDPR